MRRVRLCRLWLVTSGEEAVSGRKISLFSPSVIALLRRLFAVSACLDVGHWSRARSLIGSPEQTHQLTSSPSGRDASLRKLTIIWWLFGSAGFSAAVSNKRASRVQIWLRVQYLVVCVCFYIGVIIIISCLRVCFSRLSSTSPGVAGFFFTLIIFHKRWHFPCISEYAGAQRDKWLSRHEYHSFMPVSPPGGKERVIN